MNIVFEAIHEDRPGARIRQVFDHYWPAYRRWFLRDGVKARPNYMAGLKALRAHMPELVPVYENILKTTGGGDLEARFLSMWCPPAYVGGCSQVLLTDEEPVLIRNYDFNPTLLDGIWLASRYCGKRVVAVTDCLWGVLDGINEDGLAVSLSFGGGKSVGVGFGIPLVLRYILEIAATVPDTIAILKRVPVHMPYSVAAIDRRRRYATIFVRPGREAEVVNRHVSTNHQHKVEWPGHALATKSVERQSILEHALATNAKTESVLRVFLRPPVYQTEFGRGCGTLYTAVYRPLECTAELIWPALRWCQSCSEFKDDSRTVVLEQTTSDLVSPFEKLVVPRGTL
jgi:predicted choloylglycine hydrolase